ncbi:MAG: lipopolysaccharide kinase InaA family protein [Candidatus Binatia bacterium]
MKKFSNFIKAQHGSASMRLQRSLASPSMIEQLADADHLLERPDCEIIKDQRKIKVGRVLLQWNAEKMVVYIKRYNAFSLRYRLQSLLARSGAAKSLRGAAILREAEIPTGTPIAAVEVRRWGMLDKSFYLSEEIAAAKTANAYWCENLKSIPGAEGFRMRRRFLTELSRLFRRLHQQRIYHNDLKDFNILVRRDQADREKLFLLDLEGVRRCCYLPRHRRVKNLVQLNRTLGQFLSRAERLGFLRSYLQDAVEPQAEWVKRILRASEKADRRSSAKNLGRVMRHVSNTSE